MIRRLITIISGTMLFASLGNAHHNAAVHYLLDQSITVEGVVHEFRLINPHIRIYFDVTNEDGETERWLGEGQAAAILKRVGWNKKTFKPGDVIKMTGHPARDGGNKMDWQYIDLPDGTRLGGSTTSKEDVRRDLDELDRRRRNND